MKRVDDFEARRQHLSKMTDNELYDYFWELSAKVVDPLLELGRTHTTPSIERSVLLRMGFSSIEAKAIVEKCIDKGLMGKGAGHCVYRLSQKKGIGIRDAGLTLAKGEGWEGLWN
ncbi:MAG: ornithine aminomutase subunit alpha [Spirochaetaceae bacterium]|jgi:D-ornithine 4,5-aminomutase subunit alpha|nr:ornithine aminomutase subunit alpha [Spirochaetaceae bacterium]